MARRIVIRPADATEQVVAREYRDALRVFLEGQGGEDALLRAYQLGRSAVSANFSIAKMVEIHSRAIEPLLLRAAGKEDTLSVHRRAAQFLEETLTPFQMVLRFEEAITTLRRLNEALEQKVTDLKSLELRQRSIFETAFDAIITTDANGLILEWNPAAERIFGYPRDLALGHEMVAFLFPNPQEHCEGLGPCALSGAAWIGHLVELCCKRADGSHFPAEVFSTRVTLPDSEIFTAFIRDITERRRLEEQRHQIEALKELDVLKDQFLSILSHELRTPITAIMGYADILTEELAGPLNEQQRQFLSKLITGADYLLALVNDLLDMSRIQAGKFAIVVGVVDFAAIAQNAVTTLSRQAESKGLRLVNRVPSYLPAFKADGQRVAQILLNLLMNAIKFTPSGGSIEVRAGISEDQFYCEVEDTGIGIAAEDLPRLFGRFTQLDMRTTRKVGGTGLGLSISKALIEAHGGTISVRSEPNRGSVFRFAMPFVAANG